MTNAVSLSSQASLKSAQWLSDSWNLSHNADPRLVHSALALAEMCSALNPDSAHCVAKAVGNILTETSSLNFTTPDMVTTLVSAAAVMKAGSSRHRTYALEYLHVLGEIIPSFPQNANGVIARMALEGIAEVNGGAISTLMKIDLSLLRTGQAEDTKRVLERVEAATQFGAKAMSVDAPLAALLEGAAIRALRQYDLPLGMRCLRARCYLDSVPSLGLKTGADFVRLSQCSDGSFGDYEAATLKTRRVLGESGMELNLKLPVTLQALWTLAELEDNSFGLLQRIFGPNGLKALINEKNTL